MQRHTHSSDQDGIYALGKAHIRSTPLSEVSPMLHLKHHLPSNLTFPMPNSLFVVFVHLFVGQET